MKAYGMAEALVSRHNSRRKWNYFPSSRDALKPGITLFLRRQFWWLTLFLISFVRPRKCVLQLSLKPLNVLCNNHLNLKVFPAIIFKPN